MLQAIKYKSVISHGAHGYLKILDQLLLPQREVFIRINNTMDGWDAIKKMQVRGAPAIAIVGCLSLVIELHQHDFISQESLQQFAMEKLNFLVTARPTAVNMNKAATKFSALIGDLILQSNGDPSLVKMKFMLELENVLEHDIAINKCIGKIGGDHIMEQSQAASVSILTHCNTGSLATAGYGTALGVIRYLHHISQLDRVYCTETRPYNQGARLTAYELVSERMDATLICDSSAALLMKTGRVSAVVVGADRVVANGDTANKIGTLQLAIAAKHYGIPFYVACPLSTYDPSKECGSEIEIEERPSEEMTRIGGVEIAAKGIKCWNPAFDVTDAELITGGIITEHGVFDPSMLKSSLCGVLRSVPI